MKAYHEYEDGTFWAIRTEGSNCFTAFLLFFVPDEYKTQELCSLAVGMEGRAIKYVPLQMRNPELCRKAVVNIFAALEYLDENEKTEELCQMAVRQRGEALEFVPEKFNTKELCTEAVKKEHRMLKFVSEALKTKKLCRLALSPEKRFQIIRTPLHSCLINSKFRRYASLRQKNTDGRCIMCRRSIRLTNSALLR